MVGLVLAVLGGAGGFYAVQSGLILAADDDALDHATPNVEAEPLPDIAFVPVDPLIVSLGRSAANDHLRFRAQLEVGAKYQQEVTSILPRIVDVLNGYLRAIDARDLEDPAALFKLRAQMLRRVQVVAGEGRIRDLLVMEFVLN